MLWFRLQEGAERGRERSEDIRGLCGEAYEALGSEHVSLFSKHLREYGGEVRHFAFSIFFFHFCTTFLRH